MTAIAATTVDQARPQLAQDLEVGRDLVGRLLSCEGLVDEPVQTDEGLVRCAGGQVDLATLERHAQLVVQGEQPRWVGVVKAVKVAQCSQWRGPPGDVDQRQVLQRAGSHGVGVETPGVRPGFVSAVAVDRYAGARGRQPALASELKSERARPPFSVPGPVLCLAVVVTGQACCSVGTAAEASVSEA